jgi:beta-lactamase class C
VASITKLATTLAVLRTVADGALMLDAPLADILPDAAAAQSGVTLRTLLSHTAGLPEDVPPGSAPYGPGLAWETIQLALLHTALQAAPRMQVRYSNVGIGLAALAVERVRGQRFQHALHELVLEPLSIEAYLGSEPPRTPGHIAGLLGNYADTPFEPYNSAWYRTLGFPWGGLIATAAGALALTQAFAQAEDGFLPARLRADATSNQTEGLGGGFMGWLEWDPCPWGLGVELHGSKDPHFAPARASEAAFGHGGQSGTYSCWDPQANTGWALLGTRTMERWWRRMAEIGELALS